MKIENIPVLRKPDAGPYTWEMNGLSIPSATVPVLFGNIGPIPNIVGNAVLKMNETGTLLSADFDLFVSGATMILKDPKKKLYPNIMGFCSSSLGSKIMSGAVTAIVLTESPNKDSDVPFLVAPKDS